MIARAVLANENADAKKDGTPVSHALLKDLVLVLAPIYNTDGNGTRQGPSARSGTTRRNGHPRERERLDLNRDFIKLEAPETRARQGHERVGPGDRHRHTHHRRIVAPLPHHLRGPQITGHQHGSSDLRRNTMMPAIRDEVEKKYGLKSFVYGDFNDDH